MSFMRKLTTEEKIEEIKKLLDKQEENTELIDEIYKRLQPKPDPILREKLIARALRSEEDIKHGRVYTLEEVRKLTQRFPK